MQFGSCFHTFHVTNRFLFSLPENRTSCVGSREMYANDETFGYATALLGVSPLASQLGLAPISWTILFPLIALPTLSLLLSIGHISNTGPVLTFKRIAPVASGLGWALTWLVGEKLYMEGLRAAQNMLYLMFSMRFHLDWAVECNHSYNTPYCVNFDEENITVAEYHHYPDNYWPAQEFNRYLIRGNALEPNLSLVWEPNEWYLGHSTDQFYFALPSLGLLLAHTAIWSIIYSCCTKLLHGSQEWFVRIFVMFPVALYMFLIMGMSISGFHFGLSIETDIDEKKRDVDPNDFWADVRGLYRTSLLLVDYSGAFTGLLLFATSRLRVGAAPLKPLLLTPLMMIVPTLLTILRSGCEGHVADQQPAYKMYISTDETMSFDVLPVCFATSRAGPLWAVIYYLAQLLYTSIGPMVIYSSFLYNSLVEEVPAIQNQAKLLFAGLVALFAAPSVFLYMPMGTKIITLLRYTSQSSIIQILCFVVIFFVYGWQTIESDVLTMSSSLGQVSLIKYLTRPTSPIYTVLLFTLIPALLCSKFSAVFDLLLGGNDVLKHIDTGASFIPGATWMRRVVGYVIMFAPVLIATSIASYTVFSMIVRHKLPFVDVLRPTSEWMQHTAVNTSRPRPHSLAYGLYNSLFQISYSTALFGLFVVEVFFCLGMISLFLINTLMVAGVEASSEANDYRSFMLLIFVVLHLYSLYLMRKLHNTWDSPDRLSVYIGVATMESAMLNGYMWMFTTDHSWGIDWPPLLVIFCNLVVRGACIALAIAIRAHIREVARPTRTRDATEIYEVDTGVDMEAEDDSPIIFDLARA